MDKELTRLCRKWQRRLRLKDWNISIEHADGEDPLGSVDYDHTEMWAKVKISSALSGADRELTVIHELLHLRLAHWDTPYGDERKETAINLLADALLRTRRA